MAACCASAATLGGSSAAASFKGARGRSNLRGRRGLAGPVRAAAAADAPQVARKAVKTLSIPATFAALKKRGQCAFVPFICAGDPNLDTTERALRILDDAGADVIELGVPWDDVVVLRDGEVARGDAVDARAWEARDGRGRADEWYAAFTSGTTGAGLKATTATHARVMAYARAKVAVEGIDARSRVCLASNATFDLYPGDVAAALAAGAAMVTSSRGTIQRDFARVLRDGGVTHVCCTPTIFSLARVSPSELPSLRVVSLAGEKMSSETLARWADAVELYNVYGATETTVVQTYARMRSNDDASRAGVAYEGFAFVRIIEKLDSAGNVEAFANEHGFVGEIAIGGMCVCDGYLNDLERTAAAFVSSPLGRVYRTGDRGYVDDSGELFLCGRSDRQIKIRGHRMELDDVENGMKSCAELVDNAVVFFDAETQTLTSHARVASTSYRSEDADLYAFALERVAERHLPAYAVPKRHVLIPRDVWPLTSSGKTDRQLLKRWLESGETVVYRPDRTPLEPGLETILAEAWVRALGFEGDVSCDIGALDAFDALGGNSINVLAVSRALEGDARLRYARDVSSVESRPEANVAGIESGEAAALLRSGDEPAACAFGIVDGPFAPCEILARPVLRDYASYLRSCGVDVFDSAPTADASGVIDRSVTARRRLLAACGRGVLPVVNALLYCGIEPDARCLRAAAASLSIDAELVTMALLANGRESLASEPSSAGTLASHVAAARGHASVLAALLRAGAPPGAKDDDKQTILHLAVRSGDAATVRVAADACRSLKTRRGGLEAWDRWKLTAAAWALREGDAEALAVLRDAGAELTALEAAVSNRAEWVHGTLSAQSEVQWTHRPERKKAARSEVMKTLVNGLNGHNDERQVAAAAIRDLVCANAENRDTARALGAVPKLCALAREEHSVEAIGALRNLASHAASATEAGDCGAIETLAAVIRERASADELDGQGKQIVFLAASAMRALALKTEANAARLAREQVDLVDIVARMCGGMKLEVDY